MIEIGKFNQLTVTHVELDVHLDGEALGDIVLPYKEAPKNCKVGDELSVFVYSGVKGKITATLQEPKAQIDEIAWLKVIEVGNAGAFLNWGLSKDLLVPFAEQRYEMEEGKSYLVKLFLDDRNRIAATSKFEHFIVDESVYFKAGERVSIIIAEKTDLGFKAIVNNSHWGVLYSNEVFQPLRKGQVLEATIKQIREDKKIDLILQPLAGHVQAGSLSEQILQKLQAANGSLPLGDKSPPEDIYRAFGVSKKVFKQAIGALYKKKLISIDKQSIQLL